MTTTNPTDGQAARSFLSLPGEIRNRIFDFAKEEQAEHPEYNVSLVLRRGADGAQPTDNEEQAPKRQFFGLTQVCRQLRAEYIPMYRTHTKIGIDHVEVYKYIDTILRHPRTDDKNLAGNVLVRFTYRQLCPDEHETIDFDILPLLRLANTTDKFHVDFDPALNIYPDEEYPWWNDTYNFEDIKECLISLGDAANNVTLQRYLDDVVSAVHFEDIDLATEGPLIRFYIRNEGWKPWMENYGNVLNDHAGLLKLVKWTETVGLEVWAIRYGIRFAPA